MKKIILYICSAVCVSCSTTVHTPNNELIEQEVTHYLKDKLPEGAALDQLAISKIYGFIQPDEINVNKAIKNEISTYNDRIGIWLAGLHNNDSGGRNIASMMLDMELYSLDSILNAQKIQANKYFIKCQLHIKHPSYNNFHPVDSWFFWDDKRLEYLTLPAQQVGT